jgi:RHS repeat-associated protein
LDALGSTVMMTDHQGAVTDRYDYGAWGEEHPILATTSDNPYRYVGELGYYTHWQDPNMSDSLQLGVRFYEPSVGRFGQRDPIPSATQSVYAYADEQPLAYADPSGRCLSPFTAQATCAIAFGGKANSCHDCDLRMQHAGEHSKRHWMGRKRKHVDNSGDKSRNQMNALNHCIRACLMTLYCQEDCEGVGGTERYLNDLYELVGWPPSECAMDRHNNDVGIECARTGKACAACCLDHLDDLDVLQ